MTHPARMYGVIPIGNNYECDTFPMAVLILYWSGVEMLTVKLSKVTSGCSRCNKFFKLDLF